MMASRRNFTLVLLIGLLFLLPPYGRAEAGAAGKMNEGVNAGTSNTLGLEALGRGGFYGLFYERLLSPFVGVGSGFSYYRSSKHETSTKVIPLYANLYSSFELRRPFFTFGVEYLTSSATKENEDHSYPSLFDSSEKLNDLSLIIPTIGAGYEAKTSHFFLRATFYYLLIPLPRAGAIGVPWIGGSMGSYF